MNGCLCGFLSLADSCRLSLCIADWYDIELASVVTVPTKSSEHHHQYEKDVVNLFSILREMSVWVYYEIRYVRIQYIIDMIQREERETGRERETQTRNVRVSANLRDRHC